MAALLSAFAATSAPCSELRLNEPLTDTPGDPQRGRSIVLDRDRGDCTICHEMPLPQREFHGNLGPSLFGVATRLDGGEIRLRIVDPKRVNPATMMPSYFGAEGLHRVAPEFRGRSILSAQEVDDVVAYLMTLSVPP